jgi:hypothetical protein
MEAERRWLDEVERTQEENDATFRTLREKHRAEWLALERERGRSTLMGDIARRVHAGIGDMPYRQTHKSMPCPVSCEDAGGDEEASSLSPCSLPALDEHADAALIGTARVEVTRVAPGRVRVFLVPPRSSKASAPVTVKTTDGHEVDGQMGNVEENHGTTLGVLPASESVYGEGEGRAYALPLGPRSACMDRDKDNVMVFRSNPVNTVVATHWPRLRLLPRYYTLLLLLRRWLL